MNFWAIIKTLEDVLEIIRHNVANGTLSVPVTGGPVSGKDMGFAIQPDAAIPSVSDAAEAETATTEKV